MPHSFRLVNIILRLAIPCNSCEILSETKGKTIMKYYLKCIKPCGGELYVHLINVSNGVVTIAFATTILHAEAFTENNAHYYAMIITQQYPHFDIVGTLQADDPKFDFRTLLAS